MSNKVNDRVYEQVKQNLDENIIEIFLDNSKPYQVSEFVSFVNGKVVKLDKPMMEWIKTPYGNEWYEKELNNLLDNICE